MLWSARRVAMSRTCVNRSETCVSEAFETAIKPWAPLSWLLTAVTPAMLLGIVGATAKIAPLSNPSATVKPVLTRFCVEAKSCWTTLRVRSATSADRFVLILPVILDPYSSAAILQRGQNVAGARSSQQIFNLYPTVRYN